MWHKVAAALQANAKCWFRPNTTVQWWTNNLTTQGYLHTYLTWVSPCVYVSSPHQCTELLTSMFCPQTVPSTDIFKQIFLTYLKCTTTVLDMENSHANRYVPDINCQHVCCVQGSCGVITTLHSLDCQNISDYPTQNNASQRLLVYSIGLWAGNLSRLLASYPLSGEKSPSIHNCSLFDPHFAFVEKVIKLLEISVNFPFSELIKIPTLTTLHNSTNVM